MNYRDLIDFEPVDSVVQLRWADDHSRAAHLVSSYVISDRMGDMILGQILPVIDLRPSQRNGGLFVVGNYGTGKSHLMSVISAVAEHSELAASLTHAGVAAGLAPLAGRFQVVRQEFGATQMPLRDVVFGYLEDGLAQMGVAYTFPPLDQVRNSKDSLVLMMARFQEKYPSQGLLVMIDELLEYLTHRNDKQLALDLAFLREMGEVSSQTALRFVAGLQEALFDNPRFQFAADSVRRVKDRFEQVRIVREDVAYVVSRRLLRKNDQQRTWIRRHLEGFTGLYGDMAERLDAFVELFPIHPAYLETFEQVTLIEKRQALREISREMQQRLDQPVSSEKPGLLSFDSYWRAIQSDASYRAVPEVREVLDKSQVLEEKSRTAVRAAYRDAARRIIHALALHRLTVGDLSAPIGLTAEELRDRLCLLLPIPERDADFLLTSVESVLDEIIRAVSGQFISRNPENGQYYLDLHKDVDFDALVEQRADSLDENALDRYYFEMLAHALELTESAYVPGFRIWQREIPWPGHGISRDGYIFLGAANERSTAQPERDFYIHILGLYAQEQEKSPAQADEIFFTLPEWDESFDRSLHLYAGAREMSSISSGANRGQYDNKANGHRQRLVNWLRENLSRSLVVRHRGREERVAQLLARLRLSLPTSSLRDQIWQLAAALLDPVFAARYPDYPSFADSALTLATIPQAANAALRAIAGAPPTRQAQAVLEGLRLASQSNRQWHFAPEESAYLRPLLGRLKELPPTQVLNRSELIGGDPRRERSVDFHLEGEWLAVMLLALVRQGVITLQVRGRKLGVDDLEEAAQWGVEELLRFTSLARPRSLPEQALRALFAGLNLPEGLIRDPAQHELAVQSLANTVVQELDRAVQVLDRLRDGLHFWRFAVLGEEESRSWREALEGYRDLLQSIERIRTPGHLRTFAHSQAQVKEMLAGRQILHDFERLQRSLESVRPLLELVYQAETTLPAHAPWLEDVQAARSEQQKRLQDPAQRLASHTIGLLKGALENLRSSYATAYLELHNRERLNPSQDARKQRLVREPRRAQLRALAALDFLPESELERWEKPVQELVVCMGCSAGELQNRVVCPHCNYHPRAAGSGEQPAASRLERAEQEFELLHTRWLENLRQELSKETARTNLEALTEAQRKPVQAFIDSGSLPERLTRETVEAMQDSLRGLQKVNLDGADLLLALTRPGMPCTSADLEQRFRAFLQEKTAGTPPARLRIQIDW
ncbi:MAG: ATP-binding protein [Chloroflexi bacterium]|nr:ATP-binding protein [Chloroflexota bacterium]